MAKWRSKFGVPAADESVAQTPARRAGYPDVRRIVMTSYLELGRIIQGLHNGTIQKLVQKPIDPVELQRAILPFEAQAAGAPAVVQKLAG